MTPIDTILRCGFRHTGRITGRRVRFVFKAAELSSAVRRTALHLVYDRKGGSFRATISMKERTLVFETSDIRDIAALGIAFRNWLEAPDIVARDPFRTMRTPSGPVPLPFHGADGNWATRFDPEGAEHILNPVEHWGVYYETHRDRWLGGLLGAPLRAPATDYLAAAGFQPKNPHERFAPDYNLKSRPLQDSLDARNIFSPSPIDFRLREGTSPDGAVTYEVTAHAPFDGGWSTMPWHLGFRSTDVRDILAMVVAVENWWFEREGPRRLPDERLGTDPGTGGDIINFFGKPGNRRVWNGREIHDCIDLHQPLDAWGHVYVAWRDRWAEMVLSSGEPVPCGTFSSRKRLHCPVFESGFTRVVCAEVGVCIYDGGEEQPVALVRTTGYPDLLPIGRRILEERLQAMPLEARAGAAIEVAALQAIESMQIGPMPALGA